MEVSTPHRGLLLDLRACEYLPGSGIWHNRASGCAPGKELDATVPHGVGFDDIEKAFVFSTGGDVINVPLATNPLVLREVTYAVWVKVDKPFANLGWLLCQHPDYGWSRAVTLNDYRLGHVSITTSQYWNSGLGPAPSGQWIHVVGVWFDDGSATVYLNGMRGATAVTHNAKSADASKESLVIGGRAPNDTAHNSAMMVSDICVFDKALDAKQIRQMHIQGRPSGKSFLALGSDSSVLWPLEPNSMGDTTESAQQSTTVTIDVSGEPVWDEVSGLFWCSTGINAYDLVDGVEWQQEFRAKLGKSKPVVKERVLCRTTSNDNPPSFGRVLARAPSDPDKRTARAAHTEALMRQSCPAGIQVRVLGRKIALFRFEGHVFAVDAECPHQGAALCEGEIGDIEDMVEGTRFYVRCKVHKFQFDLSTGAVIDGQCSSLRVYNVRVREADAKRSAIIEVGFEALAADYFVVDAEDF